MNADMGTAVRTVIEALDLAAAAERLFGAFRQLLREDPERALRLAERPRRSRTFTRAARRCANA